MLYRYLFSSQQVIIYLLLKRVGYAISDAAIVETFLNEPVFLKEPVINALLILQSFIATYWNDYVT